MRRLASIIDWQPVLDLFAKTPDHVLTETVAEFLWAVSVKNLPMEVLEKNTDRTSRATWVQTSMVQLMATPEYQLC